MIKDVFGIQDTKSGLFFYPMPADNRVQFMRQLTEMVNVPAPLPGQEDRRNDVAKYPTDMRAFYLGQFDFLKGKFIFLDIPENLGFCSEFLK